MFMLSNCMAAGKYSLPWPSDLVLWKPYLISLNRRFFKISRANIERGTLVSCCELEPVCIGEPRIPWHVHFLGTKDAFIFSENVASLQRNSKKSPKSKANKPILHQEQTLEKKHVSCSECVAFLSKLGTVLKWRKSVMSCAARRKWHFLIETFFQYLSILNAHQT